MITTEMDLSQRPNQRSRIFGAYQLRPFKQPRDISSEKVESLVVADLDGFYQEKIIGTGTNEIRWL